MKFSIGSPPCQIQVMLKSDLRGIEINATSLDSTTAIMLKSDLRGIEMDKSIKSRKCYIWLKSDLRGIEMDTKKKMPSGDTYVKIRP